MKITTDQVSRGCLQVCFAIWPGHRFDLSRGIKLWWCCYGLSVDKDTGKTRAADKKLRCFVGTECICWRQAPMHGQYSKPEACLLFAGSFA